ncbi:hypothetical protein EDB87DRAFT_1684135 [Lactarius vividus]|nr:hypothetical protein EDB87DRAFT_1684135 [Lactarius vividus]
MSPSSNASVSDLDVLPLPPLHSQSFVNMFQCDDADHDLWDAGDLPLLRTPSARLQEFITWNVPGQDDVPPEDDANNIRSSRIPQYVPHRNKALKGSSTEILYSTFPFPQSCTIPAHKDDYEFTPTCYSATAGNPNDFKDNGFTPRKVHHDPPRRTGLFVVMIMYSEGDTLFACTMHGLTENIAYLCKWDRSKTWGIEDGRRSTSALTSVVNGRPVSAHIHECTALSTARSSPRYTIGTFSLFPGPLIDHRIQFAKVHDISWGTKGDHKVSTDLDVVNANKGENAAEVAVPTAKTDINAACEDAIHVLSTEPLGREKAYIFVSVPLAWVLSDLAADIL